MGQCCVKPPQKSVNQEALKAHNELRAVHKSPKLTIDWDLAKSAQAYAEKLAKTNSFAHSDSKGQYGENLASSFNSREGYVFSGDAATHNWYDEIKDYKFGQESQQNSKIGHFSQVVWKETRTAGFGRAQSASGNFIIVGQYKPAGNVIGHFQQNVLSPSGTAPKRKDSQSDANKNPTAPGKKTGGGGGKKASFLCCGFGGAGKKSKTTTSSGGGGEGRPKPQIGPNHKDDQMVKSATRTVTSNGKKTVELTETYQTPDGRTYEKTKKTETKD